MATENIVIKFTSDTSGIKDSITEMQKLGKITEEDAKKFDTMQGIIEGVGDALKEVGLDMKDFDKLLKMSTGDTQSLRTQIEKAKDSAVLLSRAFGAGSEQAKAAVVNLARLRKEQEDLNKAVIASTPEKQFQVYSKGVQGLTGAFQAATGALQLFGVENEKLTKLAQQFQGALNITQGINSIVQLKDVYSQLGTILGVTTSAQKALTTAEVEATVVQKGLNASMAANPIGLIVLALTALIGAVVAYNLVSEESVEISKELIELNDKLNKSYQDLNRTISDQITDQRIKTRLAAGEITELQAKLQQNEVNRGRAIDDLAIKYDKLNEELVKSGEEARFFVTDSEIAQINLLFNLREKELRLIDEKSKKQKEGEKVQDDAIKLMESLGVEVAKTSLEFETITEKGLKLSGKGFLAIDKILKLLKADFFDVRVAAEKLNIELKKTAPISVDIKKTGSDFNKDLFDKQDKRAEESADLARGLALESFAFITDLSQQKAQIEIANLQREKESGIISEEQYQKKLKELKLKQAKQNKEIAIFNASIALGEALINALTFKPANAVPAALILASAVAGLNLARVIATPLPKFKEGTLNVGGGSLDSDGGMHAVIHRGEAVIPSDRNREYHPTIKALYNRQIKASEINAFVASKLNGKIENKVTASFDTRKLAKAMDRGNGVQIENAHVVGRVIANELSKGYNRRNVV